MSLYHIIANQLQFVTPRFYKERFFKNLKHLTKENYSQKNIEPELIWLKDLLSADSVMIDIGANNGSFIYLLEKKLSPKNIYAFEPNHKLFERLKRIFPDVQIFPFALSDENGSAAFKIPVIKGKTFDSRGTLKVNYREEDEEKHVLQNVKIIKLDDWKETEKLTRIDFIKIDVEGNEMRTLKGAEKIIRKYMPILMIEMEQRHHSEPIWDLIKEIENWNFTSYYLNRQNFQLDKLTSDLITDQENNTLINKKEYINNIIFVPNHLKTSQK